MVSSNGGCLFEDWSETYIPPTRIQRGIKHYVEVQAMAMSMGLPLWERMVEGGGEGHRRQGEKHEQVPET